MGCFDATSAPQPLQSSVLVMGCFDATSAPQLLQCSVLVMGCFDATSAPQPLQCSVLVMVFLMQLVPHSHFSVVFGNGLF